VIGCAAALIAVLLASWWVGYQGEGDGFSWDLASIFGTALGTTLLALATGALALLTWRDVTATQQLAQQGRDDQEDRVRPVLVVSRARWDREPGTGADGNIVIWLNNVGGGPALNIEVTADYLGDPQPEMIESWRSPALAANRETEALIHVEFLAWGDKHPTEQSFRVRGTCEDRHGRQRPLTTTWALGPQYGEKPASTPEGH